MSRRVFIKTCILVAVTSQATAQYVDFFQSLNTFFQPLVTSKPRHDVTKRPDTKHRQPAKQKYQDAIFFETDEFLKRRENSKTADPFSFFTTTTKPRRKTTKTTSRSDSFTQTSDFNKNKPDNSNKIINNNVNREIVRSISNNNRDPYNNNVVNGGKIDNYNGNNDNRQGNFGGETNNNYQAINYNMNNNRQTTTTNYYNNKQTTRKTTEHYNNVRTTTRKTTPYYNNEQTTRFYDGDRATQRTTNNRNVYGAQTTKNPLLNRPGVKPAVVDHNRPPITNRPVTSRPVYDRPFESGTNRPNTRPPYETEPPRPPVNTRPPFEVQLPISTGVARPISSGNRPGSTGVNPGINSGVFPVGANPSGSTGANRPSGSQNNNVEVDIEIGPDEDDMSESEKRRLYEICEQKCDEYKSARTKKVVALPLSSDAVSLNVSSCSANNVPLIIGGEVVRIEQFPHMALVGWKSVQGAGYSWKCGGSLLSEQYVLTAGHCTYHDKDYNVVRYYGPPHAVQLGSSIYNDRTATVVRIDAVIRHPKYKLRRSYHDVALIRLTTTVTFSNRIRPACLGVPPPVGEPVIATGWGKTEYGGDSSIELRGVSVSVWSMPSCREVWGTSLKLPRGPSSGDQLCAGERTGGKDTCQGDSGGPAQIQDGCLWRVVAVTSVGRSCGAPDTPALYATVPRAFIAAQVYTNVKMSQDGNNRYGNDGTNNNNNWGNSNNNGGTVNNNQGNVNNQGSRPQNNNNGRNDGTNNNNNNRGNTGNNWDTGNNNGGTVNNNRGNVNNQGTRPLNNNNGQYYGDNQSSNTDNRGNANNNNNWNTNVKNNYGSTEQTTANNNWNKFGTTNNNNQNNGNNNNRNVHVQSGFGNNAQSATNTNNWSLLGTSNNDNNQNNPNAYEQTGYSNNGKVHRTTTTTTTTTGYNQNNYNNNQQFGYNNEQVQNVRRTESPSDIRNYGYNDNGNTGVTYDRDNRNTGMTYNRDNQYNTYPVVAQPWWAK